MADSFTEHRAAGDGMHKRDKSSSRVMRRWLRQRLYASSDADGENMGCWDIAKLISVAVLTLLP